MRSFFGADREPTLNGAFIRGSDSLADNSVVNASRRDPFAVSVLLMAVLALPAAQASSDGDHERARAAVQAGQVLPLPSLLERLRRTHPGQVLELELERDDGRWIYEVKLLQANGPLLKLKVDAGTGQVMQMKRKDERKENHKEDPQRDRKEGSKADPSEDRAR